MVSHHSTKYSGPGHHCGSVDVMVLVCHMILSENLIKESCDLMGRSPSKYVTILRSLVAIDATVVEI